MPNEEITYRQSVDLRMQTFERDTRQSLARIELEMSNGFAGIHDRQNLTNGRVRWAEKMLYLAIGAIAVVTSLVLPLVLALIQAGKI